MTAPASGPYRPEDDLLIVKFGGSILATGENVARAAELVLSAPLRRKLVVVSAPGDETDQLLSRVRGVALPLDAWEVARLLSLGERMSARLLTSVLRSHGARARALEPEDAEWPIVTRGGPLGATVDLEASRESAGDLSQLLEETIVVVCGFVGRQDGRVTTLARGGSDTSAIALGRLLGAPEVLLVKEVPGVLDADPGNVPEARTLPEVSSEDLLEMAEAGSPVVAPEAARLLAPGLLLRVLPFGASLGAPIGTLVSARRCAPPLERGERSGPGSARLAAVSALESEGAEGLEAVRQALPSEGWYGLSAVPGLVTVFVDEERAPEFQHLLHASGAFRTVVARRGLSRLSLPLGGGEGPPSEAALGPSSELVGATRGRGELHLFVSDVEQAFLAPRRGPPAVKGAP
ncbi:MAG: hypothetical protein KGJ23_00340 [Euryarchaeota archaeon]|nr:hypothetical protein [Euryarchaeota archaeon]MDE1835044.1 hypothetical protein [Euryarchaeota archaeon]MDE1879315.1 hypothetical protein [Euryarchaeota archaeon]MDE2044883.1 hypothetical protein [Thermoplasmata archaeon]